MIDTSLCCEDHARYFDKFHMPNSSHAVFEYALRNIGWVQNLGNRNRFSKEKTLFIHLLIHSQTFLTSHWDNSRLHFQDTYLCTALRGLLRHNSFCNLLAVVKTQCLAYDCNDYQLEFKKKTNYSSVVVWGA